MHNVVLSSSIAECNYKRDEWEENFDKIQQFWMVKYNDKF